MKTTLSVLSLSLIMLFVNGCKKDQTQVGPDNDNSTGTTQTVTVEADTHVLSPDPNGLNVNLTSSHTYTLTASGVASFGGSGLTTSKLFYFSYPASGTGNCNSFSGELFSGTPKTLTGAAYVFLFFIDQATPGSNDNSGSMTVSIKDNNTGTTQTVTVKADTHVLSPDPNGLNVNLTSSHTYRLTASGGASFGGFGLTTSKLFYFSYPASGTGNCNSFSGELFSGTPKTLTGAAYVFLFFIDQATPGSNDNSGSMTVSITG
jgi:hypothetical protein